MQTKTGKIRTVKGPLGGKTMYVGNLVGRNEIVLTGPKRETRQQKWDRMASQPYMISRGPYIEARYRLARRILQQGGTVVTVPCMHPDGSYFYEFVEGSTYER